MTRVTKKSDGYESRWMERKKTAQEKIDCVRSDMKERGVNYAVTSDRGEW